MTGRRVRHVAKYRHVDRHVRRHVRLLGLLGLLCILLLRIRPKLVRRFGFRLLDDRRTRRKVVTAPAILLLRTLLFMGRDRTSNRLQSNGVTVHRGSRSARKSRPPTNAM